MRNPLNGGRPAFPVIQVSTGTPFPSRYAAAKATGEKPTAIYWAANQYTDLRPTAWKWAAKGAAK
jgi:hypothetical protein